MTLVVARLIGDTAHIFADTLITGPGQDLRRRELHLKLLAIDRDILIGYAGSPELAHRAIADASRLVHLGASAIVERLEQVVGCDFIVVFKTRIIEIKSGLARDNLSAAWVGDYEAFSRLQELVLSDQGGTPIEDQLYFALDRISEDQAVESVGGPVVRAKGTEDGVLYVCMMRLRSPANRHRLDEWQTLDFGDAARGGFGYTTIVPTEAGVCGWGIFYFQAFKGTYFAVDFQKNSFEQFTGVANDADTFCNAILSELGYRPQHCGQLGQGGASTPSAGQ